MLSVIVYGRNDSHGYNMHKRVSVSLNSIAQSLNLENDEIIFIDWNTPDALPSLIEDISDTLTPKCLNLLKTIRVREIDHKRLSPKGLKRPTIEPFARNIAIRNANPNNKWLLSTNTDMIFITRENQSLSELVETLPRGYYQSYRFELPEFVWSTFDRLNPIKCIQESKKWILKTGLSKRINLDISGIKAADAPGDFQLAPLQDWLEIRGFPESLLNGWGVDGAVIENLTKVSGQAKYIPEDQLITVHCNHLRSLTHFHNPKLPVNQEQNTYLINDETWGVTSSKFEEIDLQESRDRVERFFQLLESKFSNSGNEEYELSAIHEEVTYPLLPTLHFLFDYLELNSQKTEILYLGISRVMKDALALLADELSLEFSCVTISKAITKPEFWVNQLGEFNNCLLIVDLGYVQNEPVGESEFESLSMLANSIPRLAQYLRATRNRAQVSFIRAINWSLREQVVNEFETPLFNNYGMTLTGPTRNASLLKGLKARPIKMAIKAGIRVTYNISPRDSVREENLNNRLRTFTFRYRILLRIIPRPIKRLIIKVLYAIARK
jgi:hypothetical protein